MVYNKIKDFAISLKKEFKPNILVSDAAPQIISFVTKITNIHQHVICWAHILRNIKTLFHGLLKDISKEIESDIYSLQLSSNENIF